MRQLSAFLLVMIVQLSFAENIVELEDKNKYRIRIGDFVAAYAKQRSKDIIIDPRVKGWVTLISENSPDTITNDEFHLALLTLGYSSYEEGDTVVIGHQVVAKQRKLPFFDGKIRMDLSPHQIVTTLIQFNHRDPTELVQLLKPLIEQWGYIGADSGSKTLTVITTVSNAERIHVLAAELDRKVNATSIKETE